MDLQKKYKIIIWVAVALLALNLATIASLFYHTRQESPTVPAENVDVVAERTEVGSMYFRELLGLDSIQVGQFREINRSYNRSTHFIARELEQLRIEMVDILGSDSPDTLRLNEISRRIGNKHEELKQLTVTYYLGMKAVCRPDQQEALRQVFMKMVDKEVPPSPGRGMGRGRPYRGGRPAE